MEPETIKKKPINNIFALIIILIGLILIGGGVYLFFNKYLGDSATEPQQLPVNEVNESQDKISGQEELFQINNFKDDELGISFQLPESWGSPIPKRDASIYIEKGDPVPEPQYIWLPSNVSKGFYFSDQPNISIFYFSRSYPYMNISDGRNGIFIAQRTTLVDTSQREKEFAECQIWGPLCGELRVSQERWKKEKDILSQGTLGQIQCSFGGHYCEIANVGAIKMLIRYYYPAVTDVTGPEGTALKKEYVFYDNERRFELSVSSEVYTRNLAEYQNLEKTDPTLKLNRQIIESIRIEK